MFTLFIVSFIIIIAAASHHPGGDELAAALVPLNFGYADAFGIPRRAATAFSLAPVFAVALSHTFAYSRQMQALSRSRLISKYFAVQVIISISLTSATVAAVAAAAISATASGAVDIYSTVSTTMCLSPFSEY